MADAVDEIPIPKKGYDLSFLDKLDDLENAAPPGLPAAKSSPARRIPRSAKTPTTPVVVAAAAAAAPAAAPAAGRFSFSTVYPSTLVVCFLHRALLFSF